ncbi:MAG: hypothetical protein WBQ36_04620 [Desulfobaccales bacterium]
MNPDYENIPQDLRPHPNFVLWREEVRGDKLTKIPVNAHTGENAAVDRPETWATFAVALAALARNGVGLKGLGFVLTKSGPYTVIDLDHCRDPETEIIEPGAQKIIARLASYTEISPSGTGVHIWVKGKLPPGRRRKGNFEAYDANRYLTITGHHLEVTPLTIEPRKVELEALHGEIFGKPSEEFKQGPGQSTGEGAAGSCGLSDDDLIDRIRKSKGGAKFDHFMNFANLDDLLFRYSLTSQSEADFSLCSTLAWWTRKDAEQMDRIFRRSPLMREKWDESRGGQTYGEWTIAKAIAGTTEVWRGGGSKRRKSKSAQTCPPEPASETAAATAAAGDQPDDGLPVIQINNRQLRDTTAEAVAALHAANEPPELFVRMGELARVVVDENDTPSIKSLDEPGLRHYLTAAADFMKQGKESTTEVSPPKDLVQNILAAPSWPFPALKGIVEVPVLRPGGSILATPGYDPDTKLYYRPMPGFALPQMLAKPSQKDAKEAALFFQEELLGDFPFVDLASKANAMASYLTPIVRHAILGAVPAGINSATNAGTGKTMMQEMIGDISRGRPTPLSPTPFQGDKDAEWSKVITAELLKGSTIICFDNVDGLVRSPSLSSAITAKVHSGRILGLSKTAEIPVNVSWFINGNNIQLGGDLPRRCYWVRLDAKMSRPWKRKGFKHKDLWAWVAANRGRLIVALLTMARAWYLAGCPEPDVPVPGSFEAWTRIVGGILQYAGVEGFLGNSEEMYEIGDVEGQEWEAFLAGWHELYGDKIRFVKDIVAEIEGGELSYLKNLLPGKLAGSHGHEEGFGIALGWALAKRAGTRYGPRGLHLVRVPKGPGVRQTGWKVVASGVDDAGGE